MLTEQDNKVHFDKSDLIVPVEPSPFWTMPQIIMVNPEVQLILFFYRFQLVVINFNSKKP